MVPDRVPIPTRLSEWFLELLPYLEKEMLVLSRLVAPGSVCMDVGAAGGTYTLALSRLVGPEGHVFSFEPRPRSFAILRRMLRRPNVSVHPVALGDTIGRQTMMIPHRHRIPFSTRAFLEPATPAPPEGHYPEFTGARPIEVETTTLDDFAARQRIDRLDLVKIDVEGAELSVLDGGREAITAHRPIIICEVEERHLRKYGHRPGQIFTWLRELGYRPHLYRGRELRPVESHDPAENDYLFLP